MSAPRLLAIGSGKGGTGKTLIATALASALARAGERILLCDADLGLSNTTVHLGLPSGGNLVGFMRGRASLADSIVTACASAGGRFDLIAAPAGCGAFADTDPDLISALVTRLRNARGYDRVMFDLSAGIDARTMAFASQADETFLVLNADPAALTDAYAFAKILFRMAGASPKLIVNMAENAAEGRRAAEALRHTCRSFLKIAPELIGIVPRDPQAAAAVRLQRPLIAARGASAAFQAIESIAQKLCAGAPKLRQIELHSVR